MNTMGRFFRLNTLTFVFAFLFIIQLYSPLSLHAQESAEDDRGLIDFGFETQFYPAGYIITFRGMNTLGEHSNLLFKLGHNFARRKDFGKHDNEEGGGPGISVGYRYYFKPRPRGFFLGANLDVWFMKIDWIDNPGTTMVDFGSTDITVLQPTITGGYQYITPNELWAFELGVAFGIEWNVASRGEDVGEGGISLLHAAITYRW